MAAAVDSGQLETMRYLAFTQARFANRALVETAHPICTYNILVLVKGNIEAIFVVVFCSGTAINTYRAMYVYCDGCGAVLGGGGAGRDQGCEIIHTYDVGRSVMPGTHHECCSCLVHVLGVCVCFHTCDALVTFTHILLKSKNQTKQ